MKGAVTSNLYNKGNRVYRICNVIKKKKNQIIQKKQKRMQNINRTNQESQILQEYNKKRKNFHAINWVRPSNWFLEISNISLKLPVLQNTDSQQNLTEKSDNLLTFKTKLNNHVQEAFVFQQKRLTATIVLQGKIYFLQPPGYEVPRVRQCVFRVKYPPSPPSYPLLLFPSATWLLGHRFRRSGPDHLFGCCAVLCVTYYVELDGTYSFLQRCQNWSARN